MNSLKIWHISDTHGMHNEIDMSNIPEVDVVVHSGDCSNYYNPIDNFVEVIKFLDWYATLPIKYKIYVAGNHDTSIEKRLVDEQQFSSRGIIYLEHEETTIEGFKFFGSPYTPRFGNWAFMKSRETISRAWEVIPDDTAIMICHGPPKGVLDISYKQEPGSPIERCGCSALKKRMEVIQPPLMLFGHIHNCKDITNAGFVQFPSHKTIYSNGTCVKDGEFSKGLTSKGNVFTLTS